MARTKSTHCPKGHEMTGENVYMDDFSRKCRTCTNARTAAYREKVKASRDLIKRRKERDFVPELVAAAKDVLTNLTSGKSLHKMADASESLARAIKRAEK
jgi:hypothetical protein